MTPEEEEVLLSYNSKSFSYEIEKIVSKGDTSYIDAVTSFCDKNGMEIETAAKLCNKQIKAIMMSEASELNMMKEKTSRLPV